MPSPIFPQEGELLTYRTPSTFEIRCIECGVPNAVEITLDHEATLTLSCRLCDGDEDL